VNTVPGRLDRLARDKHSGLFRFFCQRRRKTLSAIATCPPTLLLLLLLFGRFSPETEADTDPIPAVFTPLAVGRFSAAIVINFQNCKKRNGSNLWHFMYGIILIAFHSWHYIHGILRKVLYSWHYIHGIIFMVFYVWHCINGISCMA
jgi:hypothetical protein